MNWAFMKGGGGGGGVGGGGGGGGGRSCTSWSARAGMISGGGWRTQGVTSRAPILEQTRDTKTAVAGRHAHSTWP